MTTYLPPADPVIVAQINKDGIAADFKIEGFAFHEKVISQHSVKLIDLKETKEPISAFVIEQVHLTMYGGLSMTGRFNSVENVWAAYQFAQKYEFKAMMEVFSNYMTNPASYSSYDSDINGYIVNAIIASDQVILPKLMNIKLALLRDVEKIECKKFGCCIHKVEVPIGTATRFHTCMPTYCCMHAVPNDTKRKRRVEYIENITQCPVPVQVSILELYLKF